MVDWRLLVAGGLWVGGLSLALAAASFAVYQAGQTGAAARTVLAQPGYQAAIFLGLVLFGLGMAGSSEWTWEALLWLALAGGAGWLGWRGWRQG